MDNGVILRLAAFLIKQNVETVLESISIPDVFHCKGSPVSAVLHGVSLTNIQ